MSWGWVVVLGVVAVCAWAIMLREGWRTVLECWRSDDAGCRRVDR